MFWPFFWGLLVGFFGLLIYSSARGPSKEDIQHAQKMDEIEAEKKKQLEIVAAREKLQKADYEKKAAACEKARQDYESKSQKLTIDQAEFEKMMREKIDYYPHLAAIKADLECQYYDDAARFLITKRPPAYTAADTVKALRADAKKYLAEKNVAEYKLAYITYLYPALEQVLSHDFDEKNPPPLDIAQPSKFFSINTPADNLDKIKQELVASRELCLRLLSENKTHKSRIESADHVIDLQKKELEAAHNEIDSIKRQLNLDQQSLPLIPSPLFSDYATSLKTERLKKATSGSFLFQYPLTIKGTVTSAENQYTTTLQSCTCPDFEKRHTVCKHMLALALQVHAFTPYEDEIRSLIKTLVAERGNLNERWIEIEKSRREYEKLQKALNDQYQSHPYLAEIVANYKAAKIEANIKDPKTKRDLMAQIKRVEKEKAMLQNQIAVYEYMFPVLNSFKEAPPDKLEQAISNADGTGFHYQWLSPEEYATLTSAEKQQRWIEKYFHHRSSNAWEAGIKYERYIGYLCEKEGYKVKYSGALLKLNDMGRDLNATKGKSVYIIQCKRFADHKEIHENHLFQLFGSVTHYASEHPDKKVTGVFVTSTKLSPVAVECADKLSLKRYESVAFQEYPIIKCNLSRTGEKIYHLPFDQQYDSVSVEINKGECYVATVDEAEALGYRHAMRHTYIT